MTENMCDRCALLNSQKQFTWDPFNVRKRAGCFMLFVVLSYGTLLSERFVPGGIITVRGERSYLLRKGT